MVWPNGVAFIAQDMPMMVADIFMYTQVGSGQTEVGVGRCLRVGKRVSRRGKAKRAYHIILFNPRSEI